MHYLINKHYTRILVALEFPRKKWTYPFARPNTPSFRPPHIITYWTLLSYNTFERGRYRTFIGILQLVSVPMALGYSPRVSA